MKQIDECFDRLFAGKKPLAKKWQARSDGWRIVLFHYHHRILIYDIKRKQAVFEWWEKPADKRGLDAAKEYLKKHFESSTG